MTERELKKLGRTELLEILLAQSREMDELKKRLAEAEEKLKVREAVMAEADSLAAATDRLQLLIDQVELLVLQSGGRMPVPDEFWKRPNSEWHTRLEEPEAVVEEQLKELEAQLTDTDPRAMSDMGDDPRGFIREASAAMSDTGDDPR